MSSDGWNPNAAADVKATANAKQALRQWKREGVDLDPTNPLHLSTYLLLKSQNPGGQVRKAAVVAAIEAAKKRVSQEAAISSKFWLVKAANMAPDLPAATKRYLVSQEELERDHEIPYGFDFDAWLVFDWTTAHAPQANRVHPTVIHRGVHGGQLRRPQTQKQPRRSRRQP